MAAPRFIVTLSLIIAGPVITTSSSMETSLPSITSPCNLAVLDILIKLLNIEIDTAELAQQAQDTKEKMKQAAAAAMGEYIDYFTEPIWEQGKEEE